MESNLWFKAYKSSWVGKMRDQENCYWFLKKGRRHIFLVNLTFGRNWLFIFLKKFEFFMLYTNSGYFNMLCVLWLRRITCFCAIILFFPNKLRFFLLLLTLLLLSIRLSFSKMILKGQLVGQFRPIVQYIKKSQKSSFLILYSI